MSTMSRTFARGPARLAAAMMFGVLLLPAKDAQAASSEDPDWPCVQRKVPEVSAGMVWAGPPVDEFGAGWRNDIEVSQLAGTIARRAVSLEDARKTIADFAAGLENERNAKLTMLFAGTLTVINKERSQIIDGIQRYSRRQAALAKRIKDQTAAFNQLTSADDEAQKAKRAELQEQILWDSRIYDERERSLIYVCEQPVLLEQRIFALSREIMNHLE